MSSSITQTLYFLSQDLRAPDVTEDGIAVGLVRVRLLSLTMFLKLVHAVVSFSWRSNTPRAEGCHAARPPLGMDTGHWGSAALKRRVHVSLGAGRLWPTLRSHQQLMGLPNAGRPNRCCRPGLCRALGHPVVVLADNGWSFKG